METKEIIVQRYSTPVTEYEIRTESYRGRPHMVVPVVMMREGVHHGSHGPLLHLAEDLGRYVQAWNGIPVTIYHPEQDGSYVSANSPNILERSVGRVFNTSMDGDKLKAEVWLDVQRLTAVSPTALSYIQRGRHLDVSVGVFTDEEQVSGTHNEEQYSAIARNHRPDHLALLPGEQGACSWTDGCGIRANSDNLNANIMNDELITQLKVFL